MSKLLLGTAFLTILELLDQLEAGIVELRARAVTPSGTTTAKAKARRPKKAKPSTKSKPRKKTAAGEAEPAQLSFDKPEPVRALRKGSEEKPAVGKRQALGRSLLQLRRMSASPTSEES